MGGEGTAAVGQRGTCHNTARGVVYHFPGCNAKPTSLFKYFIIKYLLRDCALNKCRSTSLLDSLMFSIFLFYCEISRQYYRWIINYILANNINYLLHWHLKFYPLEVASLYHDPQLQVCLKVEIHFYNLNQNICHSNQLNGHYSFKFSYFNRRCRIYSGFNFY